MPKWYIANAKNINNDENGLIYHKDKYASEMTTYPIENLSTQDL